MVAGIEMEQVVHEHPQPVGGRALPVAQVADHASLPQHQRGRGVDPPTVEQEVGRLIALAPGRVDIRP
jgi:hypothetical protein